MSPDGQETPATPVGEDSWVSYAEEARRTASDLERRVNVLEIYKRAVSAEPDSVRVWLAYCEFFHSLYVACAGNNHSAADASSTWPREELLMGREIFTLDADLELWQNAYEAVRFRIGDSHILWDRWVEVEMEQLVRTKTREGIERITLLYRDRLRTPHTTWDETSQRFSTFLSEYNRPSWEATMKEITQDAQEAKAIINARERFEFKLQKAAREGDVEAEKAAMREYLAWEVAQIKRKGESSFPRDLLCQGLFSRALTGVLAAQDSVWLDYVAYLSDNLPRGKTAADLLPAIQRAVEHCPWSGPLWSRYILAAEEAGLSFAEIEQIKHAATNDSQIYRDGMASLLEMYVAWCGYLKRSAMDPSATEEAVDVADVGLPAALEYVGHLGNKLYREDYQGDPDFRLERIYIQYLTEKEGEVEEARSQWEQLAEKPLFSDRYEFWRAYYLWEMQVFFSRAGQLRLGGSSPASGNGAGAVAPSEATGVLARAVNRKTLDWPERAIAVYLQHCNDYERADRIRDARDNVHKVRIGVAKRREREAAEAAAAAAAAYGYPTEAQQAQVQAPIIPTTEASNITSEQRSVSPSLTKRKRLDTTHEDEKHAKRQKSHEPNGDLVPDIKPASTREGTVEEGPQKRDRENTMVVVDNLPSDVTQTALKKYFREFGHIQDLTVIRGPKSGGPSTALIEFSSVSDAEDVVRFRDGKYFQSNQMRVTSGAGLTLFVTNYPPAADEDFIRTLFKDCGPILSVRWPSLKFNTRRRFCYISFRDRAGAEKGTKLNGKILEGRFRLEVKYSDPSRRKRREGAMSEGREVRVGNLDEKVTEEDIRSVFGKYGSITRVNMVESRRGTAGRGKGFSSAFVEFAGKTEADRAVAELNNVKMKSRILRVEIASEKGKLSTKVVNEEEEEQGKEGQKRGKDEEGDEEMRDPNGAGKPTQQQPKPQGEDTERLEDTRVRKLALMNLPDTVNDARVMALVEPVGKVRSLVLQPRRGTAVVEYADEAAVGRASLQLDGMEVNGAKIRTGSMADLAKYIAGGGEKEGEKKAGGGGGKGGKDSGGGGSGGKKSFMAPVTVRRPVLGKAGAKRGLGMAPKFVPAAGANKSGGGDTEMADEAPKPMKSNADFKAMFLGSRPAAPSDEGGKK